MRKSPVMLSLLFAALCAVALAACGGQPSASSLQTAVAETVAAMPAPAEAQPQEVEVTRLAEVTRIVEVKITNTPQPTSKATATPTATPTSEATATLEPSATVEGIMLATATSTPEITVEPSGPLNMTLNQMVNKFVLMTDLQKQDFIATAPGKSVIWSAQVYNITTEGVIILDNPNSVGTVYLKDVPYETAIKISRTMLVDFTGVIESISEIASLEVVLVNVKISRYYLPPSATPTP